MQKVALVHDTSYVDAPLGWIFVDVHVLPFQRAAHPAAYMSCPTAMQKLVETQSIWPTEAVVVVAVVQDAPL
jgi:hypothetical protein